MRMAELSFKILIIGDKKVGRSTLLEKQFKLEPLSAVGVKVWGVNVYAMLLNLDTKGVRLSIWYISHSDKFSYHLPNFIKGAHGVVLMFDLTNFSTLNFLSKFPQIFRERKGEIPILLVGNKIDLGEERVIPKEEGEVFAKANRLLGYIEISAKTGEGCEGMFESLAENIITQLVLNKDK